MSRGVNNVAKLVVDLGQKLPADAISWDMDYYRKKT